MRFKETALKICDTATLVIMSILLALYVFVFGYSVGHDLWHIYLYWFLLGGILSYCIIILIPHFRKNINWWMKFTHELTHTLVALMFFRKVKTFVVKDNDCYVSYTPGYIGYTPITLSPYCIPIFTLMIFPFRYMGENSFMYVFDILLGFTYAFHIHSAILQTRFSQSDIQNCGKFRSAVFIALMHLFFASLLIVTIRGGVWNALYRVICEYPQMFLDKLVNFF